MFEPTGKQSVRITLLHSGLSPPIFILSNFTNSQWEPYEMKYAEERVVDSSNPNLVRVEHMFWRRFDISPGVWKYRYRIGHNHWSIYDHHAEKITHGSGEDYNVLGVEKGGPAIFQFPAVLPIFGSESSSSQEPHRISSFDSGLLSWQSTREDPSEPLDFRQRRGSYPFPVRESFLLSPTSVAEEGFDTSGSAISNEEQQLIGHQNMEVIVQSRSLSGSKASVESKD